MRHVQDDDRSGSLDRSSAPGRSFILFKGSIKYSLFAPCCLGGTRSGGPTGAAAETAVASLGEAEAPMRTIGPEEEGTDELWGRTCSARPLESSEYPVAAPRTEGVRSCQDQDSEVHTVPHLLWACCRPRGATRPREEGAAEMDRLPASALACLR
ncbi:hypothetical protein NDU88_009915 [Pleurodeles waltl]|uniref:Uncharacterized protein n=1 Tax=Pleurodeles waltl TaxID=8319 RepID=A0AAV7RZ04_PLEWA|nr:hypothetical protein NDU88_009915 [Pleurodeles waltl]